ncbi:UdgX family uracil-DNA binding protein [Bosea sp. PAMC 26642]|uniref:UdgX family uracil-DNA binding protein n=1 Tax=Bosea sp. (strain PAMC 26642) TaxID=1792307 RepID=UPI00076FE288|nr:UdgX family uracil-DNA binding protein [Bosea sp. PAMC 26642]AMJ60566.1 DNA polymerase [Bosea sp. PAMC 26642]
MFVVRLAHPADFEGWRRHARVLVRQQILPGDIAWQVGDGLSLFDGQEVDPDAPVSGLEPRVPRDFPELAAQVACHRDPERFGLIYRLLLRLQGEPHLLNVATDIDVHRAEAMARAVRRDMHKMTAFVRFREIADAEGREAFVAWFEPEHFIVERVSSFFVKRFSAMRWSILTPLRSLHWDGETLHLTAGAAKADAPSEDAMEAYWRTYYANIFNPARLKIKAMQAEMPQKYWKNLPEAALISPLIAGAGRRAQEMVLSAPTLPPERHLRQSQRQEAGSVAAPEAIESWEQAAAAARDCRRCGLCEHATQTVFGEGPLDAPVMFVGEQPGDQEDLAGKPFVGPAGQVFDKALGEAGLARRRAYVTNAVKHFKFELRGKRRIHQKPNAGEITACRFWLGLEREFVKPRLVVALGASALKALTGHSGSLASVREGDLALDDGTPLLATVHPSYLLRLPDEEAKISETARFIADLRRVGVVVPEMMAQNAA